MNAMIDIWGIEGTKPSGIRVESMEKRPDADLIEGPQLEGSGVSQDDVDRMLDNRFSMTMRAADEQGLEQGEAPAMNGLQCEDESSEPDLESIDSQFN